MNLNKLIKEKAKRLVVRAAVRKTILELDFSVHIMRSVVHAHVCEMLGKKISNQLINKIKRELINERIVPTRSGNRLYYHNVDNCRNYKWLKFRHLKKCNQEE